ncbi:MAG: hypothetical protein IPN44_09310 [Flavobacteriales bacterium]|nr:hypothetical protein [Flavobacteriales bacterium]
MSETDLTDKAVRESFLAKPRRVPTRPDASRTSILVVRKEVLPYYYAIYDHDLERYTELQYRLSLNEPLRSVVLSALMQPEFWPSAHESGIT